MNLFLLLAQNCLFKAFLIYSSKKTPDLPAAPIKKPQSLGIEIVHPKAREEEKKVVDFFDYTD